MEDFSDSDCSSESEQFPRIISVPVFRLHSNFSAHSSVEELAMENRRTSNNYRVSERSHSTISVFAASSTADSGSPGQPPNEYSGDSDSSSSSRSSASRACVRGAMAYSSDSEPSSISSNETSSSSSNSSSLSSNLSSDMASTSMGRRRQYEPKPNEQDSDSSEDVPPNKRMRSDSGDSYVPYNCPVCLEDVREREPVSTNCGHVFCKDCIERAVATGRMCPLCGLDEPEFHRIFL
ncbi:LON peptidase N-terminal domain and RING finger protein 3 [Drosophila teissieri]|uniref:LON peptidase N-terminal domain and RING finger protein 3 n=1 Tax=Drosophila teissieri TaxID=7243 RepID=UPI001CBA02E1|nr:LON peptidase N-terminal domain and RING finger protein 3 [Drosophila teissieri]